MSGPPKFAPRPPGQRPQRLDSLTNPQPRPPPRIQKQTPERCVNPDCTDPESLTVEDGKLVCQSCGTVADDSPDLVTDLQYGLEGGRAVVHGHHVGADSGQIRGADPTGTNRQLSSLEQTNLAGKRYAVQICAALQISSTLQEAGLQFFRLASSMNFIQGRRTKSVAAVALYIACRCQRENPNAYMLIDFADILSINVFTLGTIYTDLVAALRLNPNGFVVNPINPEDLILRFAQRLEFGFKTMPVANDAVRIVQRMNRDWMTPGRRPAGICGAALILAARMNNFRRTPREMVYVVKVNEATIFKRLEEFKVLESADMTVDTFRKEALDLDRYADPPAYSQNKDGPQKKKKRGRKKKRQVEVDDDGDELPASRVASEAPMGGPTNQLPTPANTQQAQADRQSMPPPPVPVDPSILQRSGLSTQQRTGSSTQSAVSESTTSQGDVTDQTAASSSPSVQERSSPGPSGAEPSASQELLLPPTSGKRKRATRSSARLAKTAKEDEISEQQSVQTMQTDDPQSEFASPATERVQEQTNQIDTEDGTGAQDRAEGNARMSSMNVPAVSTAPSRPPTEVATDLGSAIKSGPQSQTKSSTHTSAADAGLNKQSEASKGANSTSARAAGPNEDQNEKLLSSPTAMGPPPKRRRGRRKATEGSPHPEDAPEITTALTDIFDSTDPSNIDTAALRSTVEVATAADADSSAAASVPETVESTRPPREIPSSVTIDENEFFNDPEVEHCLLNETEVRVKTRIWTSVNADWLRAQAAKRLKHEMAVAAGTYRPKKTRQRKRQRIGDLKQYASELGDDWERRLEAGEVLADTTADAVAMMMKKRAYSSKINYDLLRNVYTPSSSRSRATSFGGAGSPGSGIPTQEASPGSAASGQATAGRTEGETEASEQQGILNTEQPEQNIVSEESNAQQKELDSVVGELENEGIYDGPQAEPAQGEEQDEEEEEEEEEEDEGDESGTGRAYDDDPYEAIGAESD